MIYHQPRINETILGVGNFRRDLVGLVNDVAAMPLIDPRVESLSDPDTFNSRFKALALGLRHSFNAAGDVAIRDRRYLDTFLKGYVNPIAHKVLETDNWLPYTNLMEFNSNGTPITFNEPRIAVDVDAHGQFDFSANYFWVFINGIMLEPSYVRAGNERVDAPDYSIVNTAFGVKCFIKADKVKANDRVEVVANRIFNAKKEYREIAITKPGNQHTFLIPVSSLSTFYHHKYLKLYVKSSSHTSVTTNLGFYEIPRDKYVCATDVTGTTVRVSILDYNLKAGDTLLVMNTIHFWEYHRKGRVDSSFNHTVELTTTDKHGVVIPMPHASIEDFDVFFNGWHLTPGEHYTLILGNEITAYKLKLLFTPALGENYRLDVYHNEAIVSDRDAIIIREENFNTRGLIKAGNFTTLPLTTGLGMWWVNDKSYPNYWVEQKHRRLVWLGKKIDTTKRINYVMRVVCTLGIEDVLSYINDHLSEFDIVGEWMGLDNLTNSVYANRIPYITNNPKNLTFLETYQRSWNYYDITSAAIEQLRYVIKWYDDNNIKKPLILDSNKDLTKSDHPMSLIGDLLVLDSNMKQSSALVIDSNKLLDR